MKLQIILSLVALALYSTAVNGQKAPGSALLYEITGKGMTKPSYLLGTFHAICPADMIPSEKLAPFIDRAEQVILEIDMDDPVEMQIMMGSMAMKGGKTLHDLYKPAELAKVDELLKTYAGVSVEQVKMVKPAMLSVMVAAGAKSLGCTPGAVDLVVVQAAASKKKPITGLETVASQIEVFDSIPLEKQAADLLKMALEPQKSIDGIKAMAALYKAQDSDKLYEYTQTQMKDSPDVNDRLLDIRNAAWVPKLEKALSEKPAMIAVGAGHLGGKKGVVALLRSKGYTLKPIRL